MDWVPDVLVDALNVLGGHSPKGLLTVASATSSKADSRTTLGHLEDYAHTVAPHNWTGIKVSFGRKTNKMFTRSKRRTINAPGGAKRKETTKIGCGGWDKFSKIPKV